MEVRTEPESKCRWRHGTGPCPNPREPGQAWCAEHRREYQRRYYKKRARAKFVPKTELTADLKQLLRTAQSDPEAARDLANELAEKYGLEGEIPTPPTAEGLQSVLDKYASPE